MSPKKILPEWYDEAIRRILQEIREYTEPESLLHWCAEVKPSDAIAGNFYQGLRSRLDSTDYLKAYTLIEQVQLKFIFGRPVKADFAKMLTDAKCTVKLGGEKGRIIFFVQKTEVSFVNLIIIKVTVVVVVGPSATATIPENKNIGFFFRKRWRKQPETVEQNLEDSGNQFDAKRVKTEEPEEEDFDFPNFPSTSSGNIQASEALNNPEESKISVLSLVNHIGTTALYFEFKNLEINASRAVEKIKESGQEMVLSLKEFNNFIEVMLTSIKRARISNSRTEKNQIKLKTVFKHIKLSLIRPFGPEIAAEALKIVDKEIEELGDSQDEVPSEVIRLNLGYLLRSTTGFWTEL